MKTKYLIFILLFGLLSCTENFDDFNTNQKLPAEVEGEYLFTGAQKQLVDMISSTNVNTNVWKLFVQYWTETTYIDEANYDIINRNIANWQFDIYYRRILKPLDEARNLITEGELEPLENEAIRANKLMIIELHEIYAYHNLVDIFGDVPYTDALKSTAPVYDDAADIYSDLISRLDAAIATMDATQGSFLSADVIYGGDVASWITFANSLKLRLGIMLADVNPTLAQSTVEDAVAAGVFTSSEEDALYHYLGSTPNTNPLYEDLVLSGRNDFVPANTLVDLMAVRTDPRMNDFFDNILHVDFLPRIDNARQSDTLLIDQPILMYYNNDSSAIITPDSIFDPSLEENVYGVIIPQADTILEPAYYLGGIYGHSNAYQNYSHINANIQVAGFAGILLTYTEVQFYIAEAAARTWNVGQTAEEAYNEAITSSILDWGGTEAEATAYLADAAVVWDAANWDELIGVQSYIAFYTRGLTAYNQFRRLDYPAMNEAEDPATGGPVPTRFTYPVSEQTLNATNYATAAEAVGGDDLLTKLFWDVD